MGRFSRLADEMGDLERLAWQEVWIYANDCSEAFRDMPEHRRRRIANSVVAELLEAQGGICPLCDQEIDRSTLGGFHRDHIIPLRHGGGNEWTNLQVTHPSCNWAKGDFVHLEDLIPYLEKKAADLD